MPLPPWNPQRNVWVETTKTSHGHGGPGWEFGTCLWSPTTADGGARIYENMTRVRDDDLILHFLEDALYGRRETHYFVGASLVDGRAVVVDQQPPQPGNWANRPQYYRVGLREFFIFADPIPLLDFIRDHEQAIWAALEEGGQPFARDKRGLRLSQGKYLSQCSVALYDLLSGVVAENVPLTPGSQPPRVRQQGNRRGLEDQRQHQHQEVFDYEEYVEGQRRRREATFFARNPALVRAAKQQYGCVCQACRMDYERRYGGLGAGYIEIHHLNPLSEREDAAENPRVTRVNQVTALCASCHRMIHRLIRRLGRPVPLEEFRQHVRVEDYEPA
jgi:hypothetical protein